jgi:histone H3/H4
MQRGVLVLTKEELEEIVKNVDIRILNIAYENIQEENKIFVNEEDLESILDQIGIQSDNEILNTVRTKVSELLRSFRA